MVVLPDNIRQQLVDRYDPEDIISILELDIEQLVDLLDWYIVQNLEKFEDLDA